MPRIILIISSKFYRASKSSVEIPGTASLIGRTISNKGQIFRNKLDIKRMIDVYQMVIEIGDPQDEAVKQAIDILHELEHHLQQSDNITLKAYIKGLEIFEQAFEAMNNKKWEQAITLFQECARYCPRHPQSYGNMGICYGKLGQKALALQSFDMEPKIMENQHEGIIIPHDNLTEEALQGLIEEFVTREGTDTGYTDGSLEENVEMVRRQLKRGEVLIVYDGDTQTANIVPKKNARIISQDEK